MKVLTALGMPSRRAGPFHSYFHVPSNLPLLTPPLLKTDFLLALPPRIGFFSASVLLVCADDHQLGDLLVFHRPKKKKKKKYKADKPVGLVSVERCSLSRWPLTAEQGL